MDNSKPNKIKIFYDASSFDNLKIDEAILKVFSKIANLRPNKVEFYVLFPKEHFSEYKELSSFHELKYNWLS
jgi:hypothetical protein